jgi:hypothetical protein
MVCFADGISFSSSVGRIKYKQEQEQDQIAPSVLCKIRKKKKKVTQCVELDQVCRYIKKKSIEYSVGIVHCRE